MKNTLKNNLLLLLTAMLLFSCGSEATLQKYFVEKQKDHNFISFDLSSDMFIQNENLLTQEQKNTLKTIKKINLLALKSDDNKLLMDEEHIKIKEILTNDTYEQLIRYGSNTKNAALYYTGKEQAIDELIVFGFDEQTGLGLARVLGNNMNPAEVMTLIQSIDKGNLDFSVFNQLEASLK